MNPQISGKTRTKIIATLGPSSDSLENIKALIMSGVDVFRLNFSHGDHNYHDQLIDRILQANNDLNTHVAILADLQGPKIRLGKLEGDKPFEIFAQDKITLTTIEQLSTPKILYCTYEALANDVGTGDTIKIDDGKIELKVLKTDGRTTVETEVVFGGIIKANKGVNLPDSALSTSCFTEKDNADIEFILTKPVNWIALSFVRSAEDISKLKGIIQFKNHPARVIAKMERPEAIKNADAIIEKTDAVMIARGDLGVELPIEQVPILQKELVRKCLKAAKPVIIATQMMESMIDNPSPTRAEVNDVANAVFDGADALMLSGETAMGKHPVRVIDHFVRIIQEIEMNPSKVIYGKFNEPERDGNDYYFADVVCYNAAKIAQQLGARCIIGMTHSGYTAFKISSFRPEAHTYIFTPNRDLLNAVSLVWGVTAFYYNRDEGTDSTVLDVHQVLRDNDLIRRNDLVINTLSMPLSEKGKTNTVKITEIR
ncbi:MAG: pyruvate kinase [Sphingobacteriales bacterium]|jgi:pyruvate kinase|nr:pyruvate kinase [Sphingobacteriales bacterium]MBP9140415.1 pyruvate kinase [Chitinophagales bacterium]MDA0197320.1 pyruvate kinase [Bacteroidota bacterium]MBK6890103.1 pyruvate kinase [Sphingobacteriales bacterium]MBK7527370.1 pyruvate kinase [Sphingobacteriales bacterium]